MSDSSFALPSRPQRLLDRAAAEMGNREMLATSAAFRSLTRWLTHDDRFVDLTWDHTLWIHVFHTEQVTRQLERTLQLYPADAEPMLGDLAEDAVRAFQDGLEGDDEFFDDAVPSHIAVPMRTSDGVELVLGLRVVEDDDDAPADDDAKHESSLGEWHGLFRSRESYRAWLRAQGYWTSMAELDPLTDREIVRTFWGPLLARVDWIDPEELDERWYLSYRFYIVEENAETGVVDFEDAWDDENVAYYIYFERIAEHVARCGEPGRVLLLDCRERRVVSASQAVNEDEVVRKWFGGW